MASQQAAGGSTLTEHNNATDMRVRMRSGLRKNSALLPCLTAIGTVVLVKKIIIIIILNEWYFCSLRTPVAGMQLIGVSEVYSRLIYLQNYYIY